ncbi:MAG: ankyrin repeat domain-containing protein [bacterium]|nr:ankyrin repeat domain-containing protein [bacterium]
MRWSSEKKYFVLMSVVIVLILQGCESARTRPAEVEKGSGHGDECEVEQTKSPPDPPESFVIPPLGSIATLHEAAEQGDITVVSNLLRQGIPPDGINSSKETPLHLAAEGGHTAVVRKLLAAGAFANATNSHGLTPLDYAVNSGHRCPAVFLRRSGAKSGRCLKPLSLEPAHAGD